MAEDFQIEHPYYQRMKEDWCFIDHVLEGDRAIKKNCERYLPKEALESHSAYGRRLAQALFYNVTKRAIKGLVGQVFRKPPDENISEELSPFLWKHWENIDRCGNSVYMLSRNLFEKVIQRGHAFLMVDHPPMMEGMSLGLAEEFDIRPYVTIVDPIEITNWSISTLPGGKKYISMIVRKQTILQSMGSFKKEEVLKYTVYTPGYFRVWTEEKKDSGKFFITDEGEMKMDGDLMKEIPIYPIYAEKLDDLVSAPPMLDFARENIRYFQIDSDRRHSNHVRNFPIPCFAGVSKTELGDIVAGAPETGLSFTDPGAKWGYLEPQGLAAAEARNELLDSEKKMAIYTFRMFDTRDDRAVYINQMEKSMDAAQEGSFLASMAIATSEGITQALEFARKWAGETGGEPLEFSLNRDYTAIKMDPQTMNALVAMVEKGLLSADVLWDNLRKNEIDLPDNDTMMEKIQNGLFGFGTFINGPVQNSEETPNFQNMKDENQGGGQQ